jgi:hypothetical protein
MYPAIDGGNTADFEGCKGLLENNQEFLRRGCNSNPCQYAAPNSGRLVVTLFLLMGFAFRERFAVEFNWSVTSGG